MPGILASSGRPDLFLVGVTGSMGCGKSHVTALLVGHGARSLDADAAARRVLEPGSPGWQAVLDRFGPGVLSGAESAAADGPEPRPVDRRRLGELVFADPRARADLEAIIHPRVRALHAETLAAWQESGAAGRVVVVLDIPLLFETGSAGRFDLTVSVACGQSQWSRLQARSGMSAAVQRQVIARQWPEAEKNRRADRVIDNSGSPERTAAQVAALWDEIGRLVQASARRAWPDAWTKPDDVP